MSSKISKKQKKPLDLPLGKASSQKEVDLSHVRLPIDTSVFGFKQVLTLFETATNEVKNYLAYECDLMYECRLCRTIFRSLANFILHKRKYCRDKYTPAEDPAQKCRETNGIFLIQKDIELANKIINESKDTKNTAGHHLNPIIEKLMKKQEHQKFVENLKNENLSDKSIPGTEGKCQNKILLEAIDTSNVAVFQTAPLKSNLGDTEFMKSEVMEIHSIFNKDEAIIGSDGKVLFSNSIKKEETSLSKNTLVCTECNVKFSTKKTLAYHVKYKHNNTRLVYPCPICKDSLANAWSVYRHLLKVHRKTSTQIRKYRNIIHNGATCKRVEELPTRLRKDMKEVVQENDEQNEWLDNVEGDNDLQMCGGCGKRFERKAALISHSVMCTKRIALCNSIKENCAKKKEADDRGSKLKEKIPNKPQAIGAAKRKPESLITYKPKTDNSMRDINIISSKSKTDTSVKVEFSKQCPDEIVTITSDDDSNTYHDSLTESNTVVQNFNEKEDHPSVEVELPHSGDVESPSRNSEENFSSEMSDRSGSPCKGFENNQPLRISDISRMFPSEVNEMRIPNVIDCNQFTHSDPNHILQNVESSVPDFVQAKSREIVPTLTKDCGLIENDNVQASPSPESKSASIDIDQVLCLNNNMPYESVRENIELVLCHDQCNYSQDVSFKSVIKDIMDDAENQLMNEKVRDEIENTDFRESTVIIDEDIESRNNICSVTEIIPLGMEFNNGWESLKVNVLEHQRNDSVDLEGTSETKRKRIDSTNNEPLTNKLVPVVAENDALTEIEDEVFISRITPYTDMPNLLCSLCGSQFNSLSHLLLHMSIHFSWYRYQCSKCSFMSYNKCDCESHVHKEHQIPFSQIQNTVLPIPTWKTTTISDNVTDLEPSNHYKKTVHSREEGIQANSKKLKTEEHNIDLKFEPVKYGKANGRQNSKTKDIIDGYIDLTTDEDDKVYDITKENAVQNNTIAINIEEKSINTSSEFTASTDSPENHQLSPDMSKQDILEVILGDEHKKKKYENTERSITTEYVRVPRNRVKSIKTSQKDFIYELNVVRNKSLK